MTKNEYNSQLKATIQLGHDLIFKCFEEDSFHIYNSNIIELITFGYKNCTNESQIKTCEIIERSKPEDFRLDFFGRLFYPHGKGTMGKVSLKNTDMDIKKRDTVQMNCYLPILEIKGK